MKINPKRLQLIEKRLPIIREKQSKGEHLRPGELAMYNNYKYPESKITYLSRAIPGQSKRMPTDVKDFITPNNFLVDNVLKSLKIEACSSLDEKVVKIQKWVVDNIKYTSDSAAQGFVEFWQFPFETLSLRTGDCEDGAILLASLMIGAGVPPFRVRVAGGLVKTHVKTAPQGGHGWCCYLREEDAKWIPIDWCYYPRTTKNLTKRKTLKEETNYIESWFSWNNMFSWGKSSFELDKRIKK
jgi:predicted transglutaminase-like cysteine proteinase